MSVRKGIRKECPNGHVFYKSSDRLSCPKCEALHKPTTGFLATLSGPARSALEHVGIVTVQKLSEHTEKEILKLHGMGPGSLFKLREALASEGFQFKVAGG